MLGLLEDGRHQAGPGHYETLSRSAGYDDLPLLTFTSPHGMDHVEHTRPPTPTSRCSPRAAGVARLGRPPGHVVRRLDPARSRVVTPDGVTRLRAWSPTPQVRPARRCSRRRSAPTSSGRSPQHGDREALVEVRHRTPLDVRRAGRRRRRPRAGADRRRRRQGRPGRHLGAELRRVDAGAVRHRQGRRDRGQRQPGLPHPRAGLRAEPVRAAAAVLGGVASRPATTAAMVDEVRADTARPGPGRLPRHRRLGRDRSTAGADLPEDAVRGADGHARARRPDQHPVHLRHHRLPQGRDALAPQHPQQRVLRHRDRSTSPSRTGWPSRCPSTTASGW